jgi:hypothetical protein
VSWDDFETDPDTGMASEIAAEDEDNMFTETLDVMEKIGEELERLADDMDVAALSGASVRNAQVFLDRFAALGEADAHIDLHDATLNLGPERTRELVRALRRNAAAHHLVMEKARALEHSLRQWAASRRSLATGGIILLRALARRASEHAQMLRGVADELRLRLQASQWLSRGCHRPRDDHGRVSPLPTPSQCPHAPHAPPASFAAPRNPAPVTLAA